MTQTAHFVLDASALLAFLNLEPGAPRVNDALVVGSGISAVNWAEVLSKLSDAGREPDEVVKGLTSTGFLGHLLEILDVDREIAEECARLRPSTRALGLSMGDRICLATGIVHKLPVLTADRLWSRLKLKVQVTVIR